MPEPNIELISQLKEAAEINKHNTQEENIPEGFLRGNKVTWVSLKPKEWGVETEESDSENILVKQVDIPIEHKNVRYVISTLSYEIPCDEKDKEEMTLIVWGGGSADAYSEVKSMKRIANAIEKDNFPYKINLVVMPQILGSTRSDNPDMSEQTNFQVGAEVFEKIVDTPELNITEKFGLVGYSAGGAQALEFALLMGDRPQFVALGDPIGLAEHNSLQLELLRDLYPKAYNKYREEGNSRFDSLTKAFTEARHGLASSYGIPKNIFEFASAHITDSEQSRIIKNVGKDFGVENSKAVMFPFKILKTDSTAEARSNLEGIPIVYQPNIEAEVSNALWERLKTTIQNEFSDREYTVADFRADLTGPTSSKTIFMSDSQPRIRELVEKELQEIFPNDDTQVLFSPYDSPTHGGVFAPDTGQDYWDHLIDNIKNVIETSNGPHSNTKKDGN